MHDSEVAYNVNPDVKLALFSSIFEMIISFYFSTSVHLVAKKMKNRDLFGERNLITILIKMRYFIRKALFPTNQIITF